MQFGLGAIGGALLAFTGFQGAEAATIYGELSDRMIGNFGMYSISSDYTFTSSGVLTFGTISYDFDLDSPQIPTGFRPDSVTVTFTAAGSLGYGSQPTIENGIYFSGGRSSYQMGESELVEVFDPYGCPDGAVYCFMQLPAWSYVSEASQTVPVDWVKYEDLAWFLGNGSIEFSFWGNRANIGDISVSAEISWVPDASLPAVPLPASGLLLLGALGCLLARGGSRGDKSA